MRMRAGQAIAFLLLLSSLSTAHCLAQVAPDLRPPQPPSNLEAPSSAPQVAAPSPSLAPSPVTTSSPLQTSPPHPSYQAAITLVTKNNLKFILALLAGWADVACIRQYKCFGIMMTGNNIKMAMSFADKNWKDTVFFGMLIVYYVIGVCVFRCVDLTLSSISQQVVALPIFLLCAATDVLLHYYPKERWHMFLLVTAFGAVNGVSTGKVSLVTCMMTGHLHKLGNDLVDIVMKGSKAAEKLTPMVNLGVIVTFCFGLVSGALAVRYNWVPNFPRFTFLGAAYCALLLLFDVKVMFPRLHLHHAHDEHPHAEPGDRWLSFFERPREATKKE